MVERSNPLNKVVTLEKLLELNFNEQDKDIALFYGNFKHLHTDIINKINKAKEKNMLVIAVIEDNQNSEEHIHLQQYALNISSLGNVDYAILPKDKNRLKILKILNPKILYKRKFEMSDEYVNTFIKDNNISVKTYDDFEFNDKKNYSYSNELIKFTEGIKEKYSFDQILSYINKIKKLNVLIVGEIIIDEYCYCQAIGKAGKEPVLVAKNINMERYAGGILAIANNTAPFAKKVDILSCIGDYDSHEEFIRNSLASNINCYLEMYEDRPTITKRRFVEKYLLQKLFEIYIINDEPIKKSEDKKLLAKASEIIKNYDLVIVADYGHTLISSKLVKEIINKSKFLAVNTQCNAGNTGMHTISKYEKADYISISGKELKLELREKTEETHEQVKKLKEKIDCPLINITQGKNGMLLYDHQCKEIHAPGITDQVVDRVGSGDTVLSVTSLLASVGCPIEIIGLIGNIVGAKAVKTLGHSNFLDFEDIINELKILMD